MYEPFANPKNSLLGPQKVKSYPKIKSKVNFRFERNKENESCLTTCLDPKTIIEPQKEPIKYKMTPKLSKNQISKLTETYKIKVVQLNE